MNHRDDFTTNDLPEGYRALEMNEQRQPGDEIYLYGMDGDGHDISGWCVLRVADGIHVHSASHKHRTTRPLPVVATCEKCGQPLPH